MRTTDKYVFFWGNCVFSNWCPSKFEVEGTVYNCSEQYMMVEKARLFGDIDAMAEIMASNDPGYQKAVGRQVRGFNKEKWESIALGVMYKACRAKFEQNPDMLKELLDTGTKTLVEASPSDTIWGIGLHVNSKLCDDPKNWRGTNWLGETLTKVRDDIVKETSA
jgi:ribA/ribD-fused uncharacterized protein